MGRDFSKPTTKEIGNLGERKAARYLMRRGYCIKARNFRAGKYEIDLIAESLFSVVFVEVKTRNYREKDLIDPIRPAHAVDEEKIKFLRRAAFQYLRQYPTWKKTRIDIVEVWMKENKVFRINRIKDVKRIEFSYGGTK